jgi:hypothetical protein
MRALATIQKIEWLREIEGMDNIELAGVLGWQVIVLKKEYQVGDKTIFCEPDSVLPEKPEFEFLRAKNFRIKTMKMKGVVSQGICFPLSFLPQRNLPKVYEIGEDVTKLMGITQYERTQDKDPVQRAPKPPKNFILKFLFRFSFFRKILAKTKKEKQGFPPFISKTDECRCQNMPFLFEEKKKPYIVSEKVDGTSLTCSLERKRFNRFDFAVCSRNRRLFQKDDSVYWKIAEKHDIENVLKNLIGNQNFVAIQGEIIATDVQGNKYKVNEPMFYAFNLIYPSGRVNSVEAKNILKDFGISFVPILDINFILPNSATEMLEYADGKSTLFDTLREGVVCRDYQSKTSFKAVSPKFLIKNDE